MVFTFAYQKNLSNNKLDFYSIFLQGVCDHKQKFLHVCVKALGGSYDVAHLRGRTLWQKLQSGELSLYKH